MVEFLQKSDDQQFTSVDEAYLEEMTDRILRLRMLQVEMDEKSDPWQWMKNLAETA